MSAINMSEMKAFFLYLFNHRLEDIEGTTAWSLFGEAVQARWAVVREWRRAEHTPDSSLAEALSLHQTWGRSLRGLCTAVANAPETSEATRKAARSILEAVRPVKRAAIAVAVFSDAEQERAALHGLLGLMPPPARRWFAKWMESGRALSAVTAERYDPKQSEGALPRNFLAETTALLGQVRAALRHESRFDPEVSDRLESLVFDYWDDLRRPNPARTSSREVTPSGEGVDAAVGVER